MDVYVWLPRCDAGAFRHFVERYVDRRNPGDDRLEAFIRAYIDGTASDDDRAALADLGRGDSLGDGFSLYVKARAYYGAIITVTRDGSAVLGLSIDDPDGSAAVLAQARALIDQLRGEFDSPAGCAGEELPPAQSWEEWSDGGPVQLRVGHLPRGR
ncbi:hypothetical protein [Winogradskya consettensis]|nr:hypothetical protein [Actinoplanes consettensis]